MHYWGTKGFRGSNGMTDCATTKSQDIIQPLWPQGWVSNKIQEGTSNRLLEIRGSIYQLIMVTYTELGVVLSGRAAVVIVVGGPPRVFTGITRRDGVGRRCNHHQFLLFRQFSGHPSNPNKHLYSKEFPKPWNQRARFTEFIEPKKKQHRHHFYWQSRTYWPNNLYILEIKTESY